MAEEKADITYPCEWGYRIIGTSKENMENSVSSLISGKEYSLTESNKSSGGKYTSLILSLIVENEDERISLFNSLKSNNEIKMVL